MASISGKALTFALAIVIPSLALAEPREWTSKNGHYHLEAEAIAFNDSTIVLKKKNGDLVAVELKELSDSDQVYVKSKDAIEAAAKSAEQMQTWTSKSGVKVRGRVLAYGRKTFNLRRQRGQVAIDGKLFSQLDDLHQLVVLKVLSKLEKQEIDTEKKLRDWGKELGTETKTYTLDGVMLQLESGDEIGVPFFMFSEDDLAVLEPGWNQWLAQHENEEQQEYESLMVRAQAMAYQQDRAAKRQVEVMKLEMLGVVTGLTSIWEVGLVPRQGVYARPMVVMVSAQNSAAAEVIAVQKYPQYVIGGVRKASR